MAALLKCWINLNTFESINIRDGSQHHRPSTWWWDLMGLGGGTWWGDLMMGLGGTRWDLVVGLGCNFLQLNELQIIDLRYQRPRLMRSFGSPWQRLSGISHEPNDRNWWSRAVQSMKKRIVMKLLVAPIALIKNIHRTDVIRVINER
jgi:hypothetical protein